MLPNFSYVKARSLQDVVDVLSGGDARILAGGTDLLGCLRDRTVAAEKVVSVSGLDRLRGIGETSDGGLRIGALTTITEIAEHPLVRDRYPGLAQAALEVASPQLRNQGTIGGNICQKPRCWYYRGDFYCLRKGGRLCYAFGGENEYHAIFGSSGRCCMVHPSDIAPVLAALEASARIVGPDGNRLVPLDKFHVPPEDNAEKETVLEPAEIVTEILLPPPVSVMWSSYRKVRGRRSWDFAVAGLALALVFKDNVVERARVVLSGAAPVPWRSTATEDAITGKALDQGTVMAAADAVVKGAEPLQNNEYKIALFKAIVEEELASIPGQRKR
jgi:xanthine dehydrogenase YagS FAD-binding subunit